MITVGEEFLRKFSQRHVADQRVQVGGSPDPYFRILERRFPLSGSKIDWENVPHAIVRETDPQDLECQIRNAIGMLLDVIEAEGIPEEMAVIAIGDSAIEEAISLPIGVLWVSIGDFLEVPQHLYVLPENGEWCFSVTMEGDLAFGYAPRP